jgi:hypothetical protein
MAVKDQLVPLIMIAIPKTVKTPKRHAPAHVPSASANVAARTPGPAGLIATLRTTAAPLREQGNIVSMAVLPITGTAIQNATHRWIGAANPTGQTASSGVMA